MTKAETTRLGILQKSFELIYQKGYQATSIDDILVNSPVTKGAFFYHFKNKEEMGLAMIQEIMYPGMVNMMIKPLINATTAADEIYLMMSNLLKAPFFQVKYGCPAVNLVEEMAPLNTEFNKALAKLMMQWQQAIEASISNGQQTGNIRNDVDAKHVACFITAGYSGIRNMGKLLGPSCYNAYLHELKNYLNQLQ
jgi:AcrR family transcriptional regulator